MRPISHAASHRHHTHCSSRASRTESAEPQDSFEPSEGAVFPVMNFGGTQSRVQSSYSFSSVCDDGSDQDGHEMQLKRQRGFGRPAMYEFHSRSHSGYVDTAEADDGNICTQGHQSRQVDQAGRGNGPRRD